MTEAIQANPLRAGRLGLAFSAGLVFAAGLVLSGMTQPLKVLGFLDITAITKGPFPGMWDPTLAFVMGGAVCVTLLAFAWTPKLAAAPLFAHQYHEPAVNRIDMPLVGGAALFGAGWGLAGYCPGPALASALLSVDALIFTGAMLLGMLICKTFLSKSAKISN
ncbi:MAG: YeeE/YedE family protein [Betaproteobacteria bacterium]|nr:YeeE/YedE family protein [Betaproteobacteria bacterium]